jgi:hypothetical protein
MRYDIFERVNHSILEKQIVINARGRILRAVARDKTKQTRELIQTPWVVRLIAGGLVPGTVEVTDPPPIMERMV